MIFVFGSNKAGRHGKGAALYAKKTRGAVYGQGEGIQGDSYAIPTKSEDLQVLSLSEIDGSIKRFIDFATENFMEDFAVTPIGSGYKKERIISLFNKYDIPDNVYFTQHWFQNYKETDVYN
jgi:hypothetical protein